MMQLTWNPPVSKQCYAVYPGSNADGTRSPGLQRIETRWVSEVVEHGLKDNKGRTIGNYATIDAFQRIQRDPSLAPGARDTKPPALEPEMTFFVRTQATRNGKHFGACVSNATTCYSLEEAKALAAKKIEAAGKRFAKAIAKGEGKQFAKVSP